jgi:type IV pilus assembly protein PilB
VAVVRHRRDNRETSYLKPFWRRPNIVSEVARAALPTLVPEGERPRIGNVFTELVGVGREAIESALSADDSRRVGVILNESGIVTDREIAQALAFQQQLPYRDLRQERPNAETLAFVLDADARRLSLVPLDLDDGTLSLAVSDPADPGLRDYLEHLPVGQINLFVSTHEDIVSVLNGGYRVLNGVERQVEEFVAATAPVRPETPLVDIADDAPVVAVVDRIVLQALRDRASDVHIEPSGQGVRVRFRVDGALRQVLLLPEALGPAVVSRVKVMAEMNIVEKRRPQDGQFHRMIDEREVDVRVSTSATIWGEKAVLRLLEKRRSLMRLGELGMPNDVHSRFSEIVHRPFGMVLCSGPTGSGKTTTLYATLQEISRPSINVMTIEDPVEYVFPEANQIQINEQAEITFASGLRAILRQDPDVILIGEVRDPETARIAVQSALTGHFVLSSIHATDAASALFRLLDMGVEPFLVASSVSAVVGQRLVRRICPTCIASYIPLDQELELFETLGGTPRRTFQAGQGCNYCSKTGFRGRIGVYEVLEITDEIRELIVNRRTPQELRKVAVAAGMRTLAAEAVSLVDHDLTTIDEIVRTVYLAN